MVKISTEILVVIDMEKDFNSGQEPSSSKVVPYSNLIEGVQNGTVTSVQFEEKSRRIFFNKCIPDEDEDKFSAECRKLKAMFAKVAMFTKVVGKLIRNPASIPELQHSTEKQTYTSTAKWEYSTRNIDEFNYDIHSLIRQNGITYSSGPSISVYVSEEYLD
ncbi:hypothetical protein F0562_005223 [Nyssa sinensis]|uniref:Peptidase M41 FtsH extracellular domain-containing protein n=1 Tax=Nyssa sinensis TaxID=561372 RepID=A0A5J5AJQ0_9ASTE|nr:hypothetical protein F0562_005223 [Nyssa sinensis]